MVPSRPFSGDRGNVLCGDRGRGTRRRQGRIQAERPSITGLQPDTGKRRRRRRRTRRDVDGRCFPGASEPLPPASDKKKDPPTTTLLYHTHINTQRPCQHHIRSVRKAPDSGVRKTKKMLPSAVSYICI